MSTREVTDTDIDTDKDAAIVTRYLCRSFCCIKVYLSAPKTGTAEHLYHACIYILALPHLAMKQLAALPAHIQHSIYRWVECADLINLALTSKELHAHVLPALYRSPRFRSANTLRSLCLKLSERLDIASLVQQLDLILPCKELRQPTESPLPWLQPMHQEGSRKLLASPDALGRLFVNAYNVKSVALYGGQSEVVHFLRWMNNWRNLNSFKLISPYIDPRIVVALAYSCPGLKSLFLLGHTDIRSDSLLICCSLLKQLTKLSISCRISGRDLAACLAHLPNLHTIHLYACQGIDDQNAFIVFRQIRKSCTVSNLKIADCPNLSPKGIKTALHMMTALKHLEVHMVAETNDTEQNFNSVRTDMSSSGSLYSLKEKEPMILKSLILSGVMPYDIGVHGLIEDSITLMNCALPLVFDFTMFLHCSRLRIVNVDVDIGLLLNAMLQNVTGHFRIRDLSLVSLKGKLTFSHFASLLSRSSQLCNFECSDVQGISQIVEYARLEDLAYDIDNQVLTLNASQIVAWKANLESSLKVSPVHNTETVNDVYYESVTVTQKDRSSMEGSDTSNTSPSDKGSSELKSDEQQTTRLVDLPKRSEEPMHDEKPIYSWKVFLNDGREHCYAKLRFYERDLNDIPGVVYRFLQDNNVQGDDRQTLSAVLVKKIQSRFPENGGTRLSYR
ncbi:hypothetical protein CANCADRAFT_58218 [Tortispora caseinolytica NRRL Y-17796]|uniref:F-box domain-containing protein n=1 Tax=Tortispora caseinolytica NRRL Y-17796 TaxID=767744 RepID=A0A1E4TBV2_9ASCO|nr:hypothetical protein CANCADRAFT_58218 [Tortispora caseinolytica NRRL Y-17796]